MNYRLRTMLCGLAVLYGCADKVPPPSVQDYLDDPIALEASMVRCAANRSETRYEAECVNARQAASIFEARQDRERRDLFEAESAAKRAALRRTQQAAAEARRRAKEAERQRREAEYLAQFGELPPPGQLEGEVYDSDQTAINAPGAVLPSATEIAPLGGSEVAPAVDGGNAPTVEAESSEER